MAAIQAGRLPVDQHSLLSRRSGGRFRACAHSIQHTTTMKRLPLFLALFVAGLLFIGADGCSSDPNVEGAKLDLRNQDYDRAIENLDRALEKNPDNTEALTMKANALLEKAFQTQDPGEHTAFIEEMVANYDRAAELGADVEQNVTIAYAREFERAVIAFNRGADDDSQFGAAAQYFGNAMLIRPDSAAAYTYQGYALLNSGDTEGAIEALEQGVENGETDLQAYLYLGELYRSSGRSEDSVALLERAEEMFPGDPELQAHLLNSYQESGMLDRAMDKYQSSIETDPDNKTYRYNYGSLLLQSGDYDGAIEHLARATELDPEYGFAWYNLGAAYQNKAVGYNDQVVALDDQLREQRATMSSEQVRQMESDIDALIEQRRETFQQAIGPLERALALNEPAGEDVTQICVALYTAYVQTDQLDKAEGVAGCAGLDE